MERPLRFFLFVLLLAIGVGALQVWKDQRAEGGAWFSALTGLFQHADPRRLPEKYTVAEAPLINVKDVDVLVALSRQRILLAKAVVPSVVSITSSKSVQAQRYHDDPVYQFFHGNLRQDQDRQREGQLGSGAIVSKEGHIVTNDHVIKGMDEIEVELSDGRRRPARLIGTDAATDIAVLKIDAPNLQPLPFGDSERVEVGETVMAVGDPYGLEESVTQGIISAKGRRGTENISDLFQTDAAINPGNSGGPLINVRGELIGINEAIFSRSGGWQGVGFAIPSATVRRSMDSILKTGRVIHGYLGIKWRPLNPDLAREQGFADPRGVVVDHVMPGSPAEKAAIRAGDVIQKFNDKAINDFDDLRRGVAEVEVDATVPIEFSRAGRVISVKARIAEEPPDSARLSQAPAYRAQPPATLPPPAGDSSGSAGGILGAVQVRELTPPDLGKLALPEGTKGVMVTRVAADSPAAPKVRPGDIIEGVNEEPVATPGAFARVIRDLPDDESVLLSVIRDRTRMLVVIDPG